MGFEIWIQTDRPGDVLVFQIDSVLEVDTIYWDCINYSGPNCVDSTSVPSNWAWDFIHVDSHMVQSGFFDTTGTLLAGWEYVETRTISGNGTDLLIVGIADLPGGPITKGFAPQTGGTLIKILADVFEDSDPFTDSIVHLMINTNFRDFINFAVTDPNWSPWKPIQFEDTNCFVCTQWNIDSTICLNWQQASIPPCDSIVITLDTFYILDTSKVCINNGSVKILPTYTCSDINGDGNAGNILDLTYLVSRIFRGGPAPNPPQAGDVNCDGGYGNILDLTSIVDRIFRSGPPLCSGPGCPVSQ